MSRELYLFVYAFEAVWSQFRCCWRQTDLPGEEAWETAKKGRCCVPDRFNGGGKRKASETVCAMACRSGRRPSAGRLCRITSRVVL